MKKLKTFLTTIMLAVLLAIGFAPTLPKASFGRAAAADVLSGRESLFLIDISLVKVHGDDVYVYDQDDQMLKVVSGGTRTFKAENDRVEVGNIKDFLFIGETLLTLTSAKQEPHNATLSAFSINADTFGQEIDVEGGELLSTLDQAKSVEVVSGADESYILSCPTDPVAGQFEIAKIAETEGKVVISDVKTFNISASIAGGAPIQNYDFLRIVFDKSDKFFMIFVAGKDIISCSLDPKSPQTITGQDKITVNGETEITKDIIDLGFVRPFGQESDEVAILTDDLVTFWTLDTEAKTLTEAERAPINLSNAFVLTDTSAGGEFIAIISNEAQALKIYDLGEEEFEPDGYLLENDSVHEILYETRDYSYYKVKTDTPVKETPYTSSLKPLATAKEGSYVAVIGKGYNQNDKLIDGWDYVLYTENGVNYYGYVSIEDTRLPLDSEVENFDKKFVTVIAYTDIYSLPSNVVDQKNVVVREVESSSSARLEVLSTLNDYSTTNGELVSKYLLVRVNGRDDQIGFIDRGRLQETSLVQDRVVPNATVMRDNSQIFVEADDKGEVIYILNKGDRVKVIGKRDTITNYTKVTFNDDEGNELTGYIYTYNLEADSWNVVQFVGMLLVVINIVLLIVIVIIKNKVTR